MTQKFVLVIGAGPAGLTAAKTLLQAPGRPFAVRVFEQSQRLGGIWAFDEPISSSDDQETAEPTGGDYLGPQTPTNLSRFSVSFSDLDWKGVRASSGRDVPMFPKAWMVGRYLKAYWERYVPEGTVEFGKRVVRAEREDRKWKITATDVPVVDDAVQGGREEVFEFDYLVVATGFFSQARALSSHNLQPNLFSRLSSVPTVHTSRFRTLKDIFPKPSHTKSKIILIVGGGNSAGEAAAAVAQQLSDAWYAPESGKQNLYEGCRIVHVSPRPLYAVPPFVPVDETSTSFVPVDLKLYDLSKRPPGPITGKAGLVEKAVKDAIHGVLQEIIGGNQADLNSLALEVPKDEPRSATHVALSESYPEYVRNGLIEVINGRVMALRESVDGTVSASIKHVEKETNLDNIGVIIDATGYSPSTAVDFLSAEIKQDLQYDPSSPRLPLILQQLQTMAPKVPELAFIGFYEGPYWGVMEMQARLTVERWRSEKLPEVKPFEKIEKLRELRDAMRERNLNVPQYWLGDYTGYLEEMASYLSLQRNDGDFGTREGCTTPARYLSEASDKSQAEAVMRDLYATWNACRTNGKYVARAAFRALQGNWAVHRTIDSSLPSFPSGNLVGKASFHPRLPTKDKSGLVCDLEYLYIESGTLNLSNGASMPAKRRYVYRYSEEHDELSVWFVKPDEELEVDYLFHSLHFIHPEEAKKQGACVAKADHLCVEDMYWTEYRFPIKGITLHDFETKHTVRGPNKDYVATSSYSRLHQPAV